MKQDEFFSKQCVFFDRLCIIVGCEIARIHGIQLDLVIAKIVRKQQVELYR